MSRLIDADLAEIKLRQRLIETAINNVGVKTDADYLYKEVAENRLKNWLDEVPTIEPKKGRWMTSLERTTGGHGVYTAIVCSECGKRAVDMYSFCPNCGCDMRGDNG